MMVLTPREPSDSYSSGLVDVIKERGGVGEQRPFGIRGGWRRDVILEKMPRPR